MIIDNSKSPTNISELTDLFTNATNLKALLSNIVEMIASYMEVELCSLYLYDEDAQLLILKASKVHELAALDTINQKRIESLLEIVLQDLRDVVQGNLGENSEFNSFLAIPMLRGQNRIGVMMLQSVKKGYFTLEKINAFHAITSPLVTTIEMAKLLFSFDHPQVNPVVIHKPIALKFFQGRVGSEGFASGNSLVFAPLLMGDSHLLDGGRLLTLKDFHCAVALAEKELYAMQKNIEEKLLDVVELIFSAQIMMLKDQALIGAMETMIEKGILPQDAVRAVVAQYVARFDQMTNEYVREKRYDVIDVGRRILMNMFGGIENHDQYASKIIIVRELLPSDVLKFSLQQVAGMILLSGGVTSHVAILSRSLNIPLVIVNEPYLLNVENGSSILLDGYCGDIFINPDLEVIDAFRQRQVAYAHGISIQKDILDKTTTKDGVRINLFANINILADLSDAKTFKAEGVGLYRTEFHFMLRGDFPSEEEQYLIYRRLVDGMKKREITFRTLDIGGDKMLSYYDNSKEANPFLGLRSIRFSLKHLDIFICQIRAILRAGFDTDLRIMFPMISSVEEFVIARKIVLESVAALKAEGKPHQSNPSIGAMIEVPSILEVIDELAKEVDFLSIGTNDLIQYMLAVDRTNEKVADCYMPHHPAILRSLKRIVDAAKRHQRDISVCGDMAHDPRYIPFLIGIGIHKFSLDARFLPKLQQSILTIDTRKAQMFAAELLAISNINQTAALLFRHSEEFATKNLLK